MVSGAKSEGETLRRFKAPYNVSLWMDSPRLLLFMVKSQGRVEIRQAWVRENEGG